MIYLWDAIVAMRTGRKKEPRKTVVGPSLLKAASGALTIARPPWDQGHIRAPARQHNMQWERLELGADGERDREASRQ